MGIGGKLEIDKGVCTEFSLYDLVELRAGQEEAMETQHPKKSEGYEGVAEKFIRWEMRLQGIGHRLDKTRPQLPKEGRKRAHEELAIPPAADPNVKEPTSLFGCSTLGDVAMVIRSKNAGPFEITLDVMFDNAAVYEQIKGRGFSHLSVSRTFMTLEWRI